MATCWKIGRCSRPTAGCGGQLDVPAAGGVAPSEPWVRVGGLKLHSVESARQRYNDFAADQWDAQHSGPRGGGGASSTALSFPIEFPRTRTDAKRPTPN